ncbi:MAG TPA: lipoprotein-releasing ABC transporter permease subunit [Burkholderiales bacterium]|nr:lipoprotein-releasing ABC transporter permease subunit [Burkholderiales bacterium]
MQYELFIGLRYTRAKRRNHFISFISLISMLGMALGVAALITVLSVMNGFQKEVRARILSVVSHVQITGPGGQLAQWQGVADAARRNPDVAAAAPYVNGQAMLVNEATARGALVRGIDPALEGRVAEVANKMIAGRIEALQAGEFGIVLGADLARSLRASTGDRVTVIAPQGLVTPAGIVPRLKSFRVVGLFEVGHYEYDSGLALMHIADAQRLYQLGDEVSGVRLKLTDLFESRRVARELYREIGGDILISDWTRSHANFFRAVEIEKTMMFIILMLIVAVAAFNVVSTLVMAVTDKQADIAILRTLGATPRSIMQVFMVQGVIIGVLGTLLGVAGGIALALNIDVVVPFLERLLKMQFLSKEVYFINELPSDLHAADVIAITSVALVLSLIATLYPSWRASRVRPAEALRYE